MLKSILLAGLLLTSGFSLPSEAKTWSLEEINRTIDENNFNVADHCSGTLISSELRLILTNYHCVDGMQTKAPTAIREPSVPVWHEVMSDDGVNTTVSTVYQTNIVAMNKALDVAVLQIRDKNMPRVTTPVLETKVTRGEDVWIVGNPMMLLDSVVKGNISNTSRVIEIEDQERRYIQYSGGTIGGNSGGALYNDAGELIAIPAAAVRTAGFLGFGIPMTSVLSVMKDACIDYRDYKFKEIDKCPAGASKLMKE